MIRLLKKDSLPLAILLCFLLNLSYANEIDLDKTTLLFQQMFGAEYEKVLQSPSKIDDEKFALDLIASAEALTTNKDLQVYLKFKAAEILLPTSKFKKQSRDLFLEVSPELPFLMQKDLAKNLYELQKSILSTTARTNKALYAEEVESLVSCAQSVSNYYLMESDFSNSLLALREALNYVKIIDKDAGIELNKKITAIQKEATRYSQIQTTLKQLAINPNDENGNLMVAEYYLHERDNIYMAWPYLDKLKNETYQFFFHNIKRCISDELNITKDEISYSLIPILDYHPVYFLDWLSKKDLFDPEENIKKQKELLASNKKIQGNKIKTILQETINKQGEKQDISYQIYLSLASNFDSLLEMLSQNKKLDANSIQSARANLFINKYIALMKANIKMNKIESALDIDKLKLELEIGKTKNILKELKIDEFSVEITTLFTFQKNNSMIDKIEINGGGIYTFDTNSWIQFNKDFEIFISDKAYDSNDKKSLKIQDGTLVFCEPKAGIPYFFKSKKRNWTSNMEVSFEVTKDHDPMQQTLDFYLLLKPNETHYRKIFGIYYSFFLRAGWFGIMREGEGFETYTGSKLTKKLNVDSPATTIWKTDRVKVTAIFKDKKFEIFVNDESVISYPISEISQEKGFPNTPIQFYFVKRGSPIPEIPIKIDNLYIGPPRLPKKINP